MPRIARVVAPGVAHHVIQRGNRRQKTFFADEDYRIYMRLMRGWCARCGVAVWAYCLMPNHAHLIVVPETEGALRKAIGEAHRRYTCLVNEREGWRGCLWQGRFSSYMMDTNHTLAAAKYIEQNPVKAGLVERPEEWPWSSAASHLSGRDDALVSAAPLIELLGGDWGKHLSRSLSKDLRFSLQCCERTGRPLGDDAFVDRVENMLGRELRPRRAGRKPMVRKK